MEKIIIDGKEYTAHELKMGDAAGKQCIFYGTKWYELRPTIRRTAGKWELDEVEYRMYSAETGKNIAWIYPDQESMENGKANVEFICKAVNNYDNLLNALQRIANIYDHIEDAAGEIASKAIKEIKTP